jgi:hypothetical protein
MSNLLSQASLVMIPSGYKEDVVYSQIPTDGSGDLSFTRASNGTRINSAGLVEVCPWNLVQNSENFSAVWTAQNSTITTNSIVAPNGTTTADSLIAANGVNGASGVYVAENTSVVKTMSCYVKKGSKRWAAFIGYNGDSNCWYDLDNGVVGTRGAKYSTSSITSVGNGWFRIDAVMTVAIGADVNIGIYAADNDNSLTCTGDGTTVSSYIWGFQLNIGSTAKPYFPTTDRLNVPRLTYQNGGGGCPSLLLEKQSTNVLLYSNTGDWGASGTITKTYNTTDLVSPDGTNNATKVVSSAGTGDTSVGFSVPDGAVTVSFWGKVASGTKTLVLDVRNNSSAVVSSSPVLTTEWQRFTLTNTVSGTGSSGAVWIYPNGAGTFYIYGAQAESSSYATSLILTNGASATSVADDCFKTGISSLIGQTEGAFMIDINLDLRVGYSYFALANSLASSSNYIGIGIGGSSIDYEVVVSTVLQVSISLANSATGRFKIAGAYKANDFVLYINGTQIGTDTSGTVPTCSEIGLFNYVQNQPLKYNEVVVFPTRLTNAELASITTI